MKNNAKKYLIVMGIGFGLNLILYSIAHIYHFPVWMDTIGTCYAAMMLEPAAGMLVGFLLNFFQAVFIYDYNSIIYYSASAMAAVIMGVCIRKQGRIHIKRLPLAVFLVVIANTLITAALTIWRTNGISDSAWERYFMTFAMENWALPKYLACVFGAFVLKLWDGVIMLAALFALNFVTPDKWKNLEAEQVVSWKNKFLA